MKQTRSQPVKDSNLRTALIVLLCATVCYSTSCFAQARETWGATGVGSAWQAGSTKAAAPSARTTGSGAGSSWSAGAGSNPSQRQPGGIWQEGSTQEGPTLSAATNSKSAKSPSTGTNPLPKPAGLASLGALPGIGRVAAVPNRMPVSNKMQVPRSSNGSHAVNRASTSVGPRSAAGRKGPAGVLKQRSGAAANGHRRQSASQSRSGSKASSPGTSSSTQSDSEMKALSDTALPTDSLGSESQSPLSEQPH